jgi:hypothetical protein
MARSRSTLLAGVVVALALLSGLWLATDESDPALQRVCVDMAALIAQL